MVSAEFETGTRLCPALNLRHCCVDGLEPPSSSKGKNSKRKSSKRKKAKKSASPMAQDTVSPSSFLSSPFGQGVIPVPSRRQEGDRFPESFLDEPRPDSNPRPGSHPRPDSRPRPHSHSSTVSAKSPSQELIACNSGYSISIVQQATSDNEDQCLDESTRTEDRGGFRSGPPSHARVDNRLSEEEPILGPDQVLREQYSEGEKGGEILAINNHLLTSREGEKRERESKQEMACITTVTDGS